MFFSDFCIVHLQKIHSFKPLKFIFKQKQNGLYQLSRFIKDDKK
jgi:hypothetical protein